MTLEGPDGYRYLVRRDGSLVTEGGVVRLDDLTRESAAIVRALIDARKDDDGRAARVKLDVSDDTDAEGDHGQASTDPLESDQTSGRVMSASPAGHRLAAQIGSRLGTSSHPAARPV